MNGILNYLKPPGMTSHDAVAVLRRLTGIKRIGHTGTLDPGASGVLPVCIGGATRVAEYVLEMQKSYRAELTLGIATDTEDAAGEVTLCQPVPLLSVSEVEAILHRFVGLQMQVPPMYSALRIHGERLYDRARRGETVERKARPVHIYGIRLLILEKSRLLFDVDCSRGTYIRTLCKDIAIELGTVGHMSFLLRTGVGPFTIQEAITGEEANGLFAQGKLQDHLFAADTALIRFPACHVTNIEAGRIKNGMSLSAEQLPDRYTEGTMVRVYGPDRELLSLSEIKAGYLQPRKVFNTGEAHANHSGDTKF